MHNSRLLRALPSTALFCALFMLVLSGPAAGSAVQKHWVFFTDKGPALERELAAETFLSERALARRAKVGASINSNDLPVHADYMSAVEASGASIVSRSRWLNAVSVEATAATLDTLSSLPFVREIRPVATATRDIPEMQPTTPPDRVEQGSRDFDYGGSYCQLWQIQVTDLHANGFDGSGVLVAMLDTGFDTDHEAYRHLDIVAERDFINNDAETSNQEGDPSGQDSHGTSTLSCVGAKRDGRLYGGAYEASFALAKTERVDTEIQAEEDFWVAAIEWADSLGADIVSSSLGYIDWYAYEDMDGNTCVTTIAADMAAARGILVVNSMGNEGGNYWYYMIAPADGDSVLSVGAVDCGGTIASFSSHGPTADGRIKPDVMAMGVYTYVATTTDTSSYASSHGTSFSGPLIASAAALLLQGHPDWGPMDVITAMRSTATMSGSPDNDMGWGIAQTYDAMGAVATDVPDAPVTALSLSGFPNPNRGDVSVALSAPGSGRLTLDVFDVAGRRVRVLHEGRVERGGMTATWDGRNSAGEPVAAGVYFVRAVMEPDGTRGLRDVASDKVVLLR